MQVQALFLRDERRAIWPATCPNFVQSRSGPPAVVLHGGVIGKLEEFADIAQHAGRISYEALVADLQVVSAAGGLGARRLDPIAPVAGQDLDRVARREPEPTERHRHVPPVPNDVDEPGFR